MPDPVTLDFSKAQPITLDFSKAQPITPAASASQPGFFAALGHTFGIGTEEAEARRQDLIQHPVRNLLEAAGGPPVQIAQGLYQGGKRILGELGQAGTAAFAGNAPAAASHAISAVPFVGPALDTAAAQAQARGMNAPGNTYMQNLGIAATTPGTLGTVAGTAANVAPMVLGAADTAFPGRATIPTPSVLSPADLASRIKQYARPTSDPSIVPRTEVAARNLSAAVIPPTKDATNFIRAAQTEVPNVLDYAKRTDNPLNTQLEFSKAAEGYAQEVGDLKKQILDPVKNKVVKTTGTGFGDRMQEGPDTYATLGDIDERIININKQLDSPHLNVSDTRAALADKVALQNEVAGLKTILHDNLAESSGLQPEQIADIRQRAGRARELADDTNAAVIARQQSAGKADLAPLKWGDIPGKTVNLIRGGPVPVADRAFQSAIRNWPGQSQPLPTVAPQVTIRPQLSPAEAQFQRMEQLLSTARAQQAALRNQP